jgi:hypothetical protein
MLKLRTSVYSHLIASALQPLLSARKVSKSKLATKSDHGRIGLTLDRKAQKGPLSRIGDG